ncbi:MAG: UDP-2,3-diacylglucosamine diphosphatase [Pirellulaceae bacterium]|nr:UDP-2,3-diacylglucosamine diphosphatase [Pirellulaceae bacterium]
MEVIRPVVLFTGMDTLMSREPKMNVTRVRSIFVSDVHLGCRYAHAGALLDFLMQHDPEYVYLVGDVIDGWQLKRRWHWRPEYNQIFHRLIDLARQGTRVCYAPGNHDAFLRSFLQDFGLIEVADQFIHRAADDSRYLVLHGDQFDDVELRAPWLSVVGSVAYDVLLWADRQINRLRRWFGWARRSYSADVKARVKGAVKFVSHFEDRLARHAVAERCDGVICGHIHTPTITRHQGITYCNTGDWVENCSALVEHQDGRMQILRFASHAGASAENESTLAVPPEPETTLPQITAA